MKLDRGKIKFRRYEPDDYWFCYRLLKRNMFDYVEKHRGGWDSKIHRKYFNGENIKVVLRNSRRIGFYDIEKRKTEWILMDMQISKKNQGRGLGTYLFEFIEKQAKKSGIRKLILGAFWDNPVLNLYKRLGYRIIKRRKNHAVMSKDV